MKRYTIGLVLVALIAIFDTRTHAAVVDVILEGGGNHREPWVWAFDYELQELTIMMQQVDLPSQRPHRLIDILVLTDSDSTFRVAEIITNYTGVTWTGLEFGHNADFIIGRAPEEILCDSITSTKLQTVTCPDEQTTLFSEPPPVLDGETFMIEFDVRVPGLGFHDLWAQNFIPEPATISLLGLGALALVRRHKRSKKL